MADHGGRKMDVGWVAAAYRLFATGMATPLGAGVAVTNCGLDLPDAALDDLCDAIMADVGRPAAPRDPAPSEAADGGAARRWPLPARVVQARPPAG